MSSNPQCITPVSSTSVPSVVSITSTYFHSLICLLSISFITLLSSCAAIPGKVVAERPILLSEDTLLEIDGSPLKFASIWFKYIATSDKSILDYNNPSTSEALAPSYHIRYGFIGTISITINGNVVYSGEYRIESTPIPLNAQPPAAYTESRFFLDREKATQQICRLGNIASNSKIQIKITAPLPERGLSNSRLLEAHLQLRGFTTAEANSRD